MDCGLCSAINEERLVMENKYAVAVIAQDPLISDPPKENYSTMSYHLIAMPKTHVTKLSDLDHEERHALDVLIEDLTERMDVTLGCSAAAILNGVTYRTQSHSHFQIYALEDGTRTVISAYLGGVPERQELSEAELKEMATKFREKIGL